MTQEEIDEYNRKASDDHMLERIRRHRAAMRSMELELAVLRGALTVVSEWRMPYSGFSWDNGSNGERDHFRRVADTALAFDAASKP